jgi:hypothetical protein
MSLSPTQLRALLVADILAINDDSSFVKKRESDKLAERKRGQELDSAPDRTFTLVAETVPDYPEGQGISCRDRRQDFLLAVYYQADQADISDRMSEDGMLISNALRSFMSGAGKQDVHESIIDSIEPIDWDAGRIVWRFHIQFSPG